MYVVLSSVCAIHTKFAALCSLKCQCDDIYSYINLLGSFLKVHGFPDCSIRAIPLCCRALPLSMPIHILITLFIALNWPLPRIKKSLIDLRKYYRFLKHEFTDKDKDINCGPCNLSPFFLLMKLNWLFWMLKDRNNYVSYNYWMNQLYDT
jgi:hypothetical protein